MSLGLLEFVTKVLLVNDNLVAVLIHPSIAHYKVTLSTNFWSPRVFGKLAISPDEGDLRLGRRLLALENSSEVRLK